MRYRPRHLTAGGACRLTHHATVAQYRTAPLEPSGLHDQTSDQTFAATWIWDGMGGQGCRASDMQLFARHIWSSWRDTTLLASRLAAIASHARGGAGERGHKRDTRDRLTVTANTVYAS